MSLQEFEAWLDERDSQRPTVDLPNLIVESGGAEKCAVLTVDLVKGFCESGPLASPRISSLVEPSCEFLTNCYENGLRTFLFPCDAHQPESPEFDAFPPHCIKGTVQSELVDPLIALPFSSSFERFDKRSVASLVETSLGSRLMGDELRTLICLGDCTDLCLYHLATGLRFLANSEGLPWRVMVPANLVATYDVSVAMSKELGILPHPGDLMHSLFLYHLELNGVEVVAKIL